MTKDQRTSTEDIETIYVVAFEHDKVFIKGLQSELNNESDIKLTLATADRHKLLNSITNHKPHIAIIDLNIYGDEKAGLNIIKEIKKIAWDVRCLVLTSYPTVENFVLAFDRGVEGFAQKGHRPGTQPELPELIRMLYAGGRYYDPKLMDDMRKIIDVAKLNIQENTEKHKENPLTLREQEILILVGKQLSDFQIAQELIISENTVKAHLSNAYGKLDIHERLRAYQYALLNGWLASTDGENP